MMLRPWWTSIISRALIWTLCLVLAGLPGLATAGAQQPPSDRAPSGRDSGRQRTPFLPFPLSLSTRTPVATSWDYLSYLHALLGCCHKSNLYDKDAVFTRPTYTVRAPKDDPQQPIRDPDSYNKTCQSVFITYLRLLDRRALTFWQCFLWRLNPCHWDQLSRWDGLNSRYG